MSDALVKNASDEKQIKEAEKTLQITREDELNDLRWILSDPRGRRFIWKLLTFCKVFESIWSQSAMIHYLSGQQDVGHYVLAEVGEAHDESIIIMMRENKKEKSNVRPKPKPEQRLSQ